MEQSNSAALFQKKQNDSENINISETGLQLKIHPADIHIIKSNRNKWINSLLLLTELEFTQYSNEFNSGKNIVEEIRTIHQHQYHRIKSSMHSNTNHLALWNNFLCEHSRFALKRSAFIEESEGANVLKRLEISAISSSVMGARQFVL